eukprot:4344074-Pyramimonas_sp.AAC.1
MIVSRTSEQSAPYAPGRQWQKPLTHFPRPWQPPAHHVGSTSAQELPLNPAGTDGRELGARWAHWVTGTTVIGV